MCANVYVFDAFQEMEECCSCPVTANGLLTFSLEGNLLQSPLTGMPGPENGVIKIIATPITGGSFGAPLLCGQETALPTSIALDTIGLLAWQTHVQRVTGPAPGWVVTEEAYRTARLTTTGGSDSGEGPFLSETCSFVQYLGSGKGVCTCPPIS